MGPGVDFGIEDDLTKAAPVPQIDENNAAMIAPRMHPAGENEIVANPARARLAAITAALPVPQGIAESPLGRH
jgi:hypothetical protein